MTNINASESPLNNPEVLFSIVIPTNVIHGVLGNNFPGTTLTVGIVGIATLNSNDDGWGGGSSSGGGDGD